MGACGVAINRPPPDGVKKTRPGAHVAFADLADVGRVWEIRPNHKTIRSSSLQLSTAAENQVIETIEGPRLARNPFPLTSILSLGERRNHSAPWAQRMGVGGSLVATHTPQRNKVFHKRRTEQQAGRGGTRPERVFTSVGRGAMRGAAEFEQQNR